MSARAIYSQEPAEGWLPWGALAPVLCLAFVAVPAVGLSAVLEAYQLADAKGDPIGLTGLAAFLLLPFSATGLIVILWVSFVERRRLATIGLCGADAGKFFGGHFIGMATICGVVAAIWAAGGYEVGDVGKSVAVPSAMAGIGLLLVCFAVQSSVEEILFRGWLLSAITRKFGIVAAVVLTSVVFSLLHYGPGQVWPVSLNTFLFSVFACSWALRVGNIWGVMGWHAGWNWLSAVGFELPITGLNTNLPALLVELTARGPDHLTGGAQGPEGSLWCSVFFVAGSVALLASQETAVRD